MNSTRRANDRQRVCSFTESRSRTLRRTLLFVDVASFTIQIQIAEYLNVGVEPAVIPVNSLLGPKW